MKTLKRHLWVGALAFGLLFIVLGTLFMVIGLDAKDMIRTALADENVTTSADAVEYGVPAGVVVTDAKTAEAQAEVIKKHSFDLYGRCVTYEFAIKNNCNIMSWALTRPFSEVETYMERFETALRDNPGTTRPIFSTMRYAAVVENKNQIDEAVTSVYRQLGQFENLFKNLGNVNDGFPQEIDLADLSSRKEFNRDELVKNLIFGTPDQVISKLKQYQDIGVDQFTYCASFGLSQAAQKRSLKMFINEVMPAFDQSAAGAAEQQIAS